MTHTDYTRNILNIKDPNIIFDENCLEERTINISLILFVFMPKDDASSSPNDSTSRSLDKLKAIKEAKTIN